MFTKHEWQPLLPLYAIFGADSGDMDVYMDLRMFCMESDKLLVNVIC